MKESFKEHRFSSDNLNIIHTCNDVIEDYMEMGLTLTLRQLYYQLVTKNHIPNSEKSYKKLSSLISNARLSGLLDWSAIEDRVRVPYKKPEYDSIGELMEIAAYSYRLPRWRGQNFNVELWVEKDALAGVLKPIAQKYHITLMVNRGYSSQSAMYESAQRVRNSETTYKNKSSIILYLGDLDPSGEDMVRDIQERFTMFETPVHVAKLALTADQVEEHKPPPNPTKLSDPRATEFLKKHGNSSWEVDALPPNILTEMIEGVLDSLIDKKKMDKIIKKEEKDIKWLKSIIKNKEK
jgi:hypothetical protein